MSWMDNCKASGLGLMLTVASHVVRFGRWWNPTVELREQSDAIVADPEGETV